jgi:hypothetical protein
MQFAVYRNYSSGPDLLLEASEWRSNPQDLKEFLGRVKASGGQGNEAVEVGLLHANNQSDLKQVGDGRPVVDPLFNWRDGVETTRSKLIHNSASCMMELRERGRAGSIPAFSGTKQWHCSDCHP